MGPDSAGSRSATRDVSAKPVSLRIARATARVRAAAATLRALRRGTLPKADPVGVAKVAAIQSAKETSRLIPFCHQVPLDGIAVTITASKGGLDIETEVIAVWKTGVEMEALVAASTAALALYDMLKPVDDTLEIQSVRLTHKSGGKSDHGRSGRGLRAAVLVVSDSVSAKRAKDISGKILVDGLREHGASVAYRVVPDDRSKIAGAIQDLSGGRGRGRARRDGRAHPVNLILATGGTGLGPRDVTAEAVAGLIDRRLHGVEAAFLNYGQERTATAMLSRCIAGTRNGSLVVAIPGSPSAARDALRSLFPGIFHAVPIMKGGGHPSSRRGPRARR